MKFLFKSCVFVLFLLLRLDTSSCFLTGIDKLTRSSSNSLHRRHSVDQKPKSGSHSQKWDQINSLSFPSQMKNNWKVTSLTIPNQLTVARVISIPLFIAAYVTKMVRILNDFCESSFFVFLLACNCFFSLCLFFSN
jgi:hypothetical protein